MECAEHDEVKGLMEGFRKGRDEEWKEVGPLKRR
jgi:hypothetical protein